MSVPMPPFHSAVEELLYNIYLKLSDNSSGMTINDINTLAKLNAILTDADLMSATDTQVAINALLGNVPVAGNTLEKLYNILQGLHALTKEDIDTLAEINAIINDADVASVTQLQTEISLLKDSVPTAGNTLRKLYESNVIHKTAYSPLFTFEWDKEIDKDLTGQSPDITLSSAGGVNGSGIIFKANKPTTINFIGIASEAHMDSKTIDPTKLNVFVMVYHSDWNGAGVPKVIYTNALFNPL